MRELGRAGRAVADLWPFGFDPSLSADGNLLRTAIHLANVQIRETAISSHDYAGMGTTIVAARVGDGTPVGRARRRQPALSAGGPRAAPGDAGRFVDGVDAGATIRTPIRCCCEHHPMRNALTNVVGAQSRGPRSTSSEQPLAGGELLLLSTDGVHGVLDERRIEQMMLEEDEPRAIAHGDRELRADARQPRQLHGRCRAIYERG